MIELLVVIAIIGILSSVVLASLNSARNKGADAAIKSNLANTRAQAELFYDSQATPTYEGVCNTSGTNTIGSGVSAAAKAGSAAYTYNSGTNDAADIAAGIAVCHDSTSGWVAAAPLKTPSSGMFAYCVDSTGASKEVAQAALDTDSDVTCD